MWGFCFSCSILPTPPPPSTHPQHNLHNIINTTPSTQHHLHYIINTTPSTQHHQHNIINTTPSTQHHQRNTINTTSSTQHHQHIIIIIIIIIITIIIIIIINTTPSTQHHQHITINTTTSTLHHQKQHLQKQHHQHNIINTPSTQHHQHNNMNTTPSTQHHLHDTITTTPSTQHRQHSTINTSSSTHHHKHKTIYTTSSTLHHLHCIIKHKLSVILRGRCSTRRTSREVRGSPATIEYYGRRLLLRGRCSTWSTSVSFCVAGGALGASQCHFAWQVQRYKHLQRDPRMFCDDWVLWTPAPFAWQVQHSEHLSFIFRGRCSTRGISGRRRLCTMDAGCFWVAGAALGAFQCHFAWQVQHSEHLGVILHGRCSTWSTSREVRGSPATIGYYGRRLLLRGGAALGAPPERSAEVRRRLSTVDAGCSCVAALGAPQFHFAWQVQDSEHLSVILRGRFNTRSSSDSFLRGRCRIRSTSRKVRGSPATIDYHGRRLLLRGRCSAWSTSREVRANPATIECYVCRLLLRGRCSTWSTSVFCEAGAGLGAPPRRSAQIRRRLSPMDAGCFCVAGAAKHLSLILRGRCSARSISVSFCVAGKALGAPPERKVRGSPRKSGDDWSMDAGCFCMAGAAFGAPRSHFAGQVQHSEHLSVTLRGRCSAINTSREIRGCSATIEYYGRGLLLRGRCSTWSTSVSFCVAGAALGAPSTQHHLHNLIHTIIYTTSSTQHHLHCIINTTPSTLHHQTQHHQHTPSTLHHQHNIINTTSSTHYHLYSTIYTTPSTHHDQTLAGAALGALPSYPFCLIPADTPFVILRCGLFFVLFPWRFPQLDLKLITNVQSLSALWMKVYGYYHVLPILKIYDIHYR